MWVLCADDRWNAMFWMQMATIARTRRGMPVGRYFVCRWSLGCDIRMQVEIIAGDATWNGWDGRPVGRCLGAGSHWEATFGCRGKAGRRTLEKVLWCWAGKQLVRISKLTIRDESVEILGFGCYVNVEKKKRLVHSSSQHVLSLTRGRHSTTTRCNWLEFEGKQCVTCHVTFSGHISKSGKSRYTLTGQKKCSVTLCL